MVVKSKVIRNCENNHSPREELGSRTKKSELRGYVGNCRTKKNAGLKAVTLIATLNPVSQVLW